MAEWVDDIVERAQQFLEQVLTYFRGLDLYQMIAWGAIGLGLILLIVALIVW